VIVKLRFVIVEEKTVVSVCFRVMKLCKVRELSSQAVRIPPRLPRASTQWRFLKFEGRKDLALAGEVEWSLVS